VAIFLYFLYKEKEAYMSDLGCPKCGRTPVVYFVSTKKWVCRNCQHEWDKEKSQPGSWDDSWGPQYVVNKEAVEQFRKKLAKAGKKPKAKKSSPKKSPVKKAVAHKKRSKK
jgi:ribosomal protein L37AE/L43A